MGLFEGLHGTPGSIWVINSLGLLAVIKGHEPPEGPFYDLDTDLKQRIMLAEGSLELGSTGRTMSTVL